MSIESAREARRLKQRLADLKRQRYIPGTEAYAHRLEQQRLYNAAYQQAKRRRAAEALSHQPRALVVHPRWPVPLKGTIAASLFFGLRPSATKLSARWRRVRPHEP